MHEVHNKHGDVAQAAPSRPQVAAAGRGGGMGAWWASRGETDQAGAAGGRADGLVWLALGAAEGSSPWAAELGQPGGQLSEPESARAEGEAGGRAPEGLVARGVDDQQARQLQVKLPTLAQLLRALLHRGCRGAAGVQ